MAVWMCFLKSQGENVNCCQSLECVPAEWWAGWESRSLEEGSCCVSARWDIAVYVAASAPSASIHRCYHLHLPWCVMETSRLSEQFSVHLDKVAATFGQNQHQKWLTGANEKRDWGVTQWSQRMTGKWRGILSNVGQWDASTVCGAFKIHVAYGCFSSVLHQIQSESSHLLGHFKVLHASLWCQFSRPWWVSIRIWYQVTLAWF